MKKNGENQNESQKIFVFFFETWNSLELFNQLVEIAKQKLRLKSNGRIFERF